MNRRDFVRQLGLSLVASWAFARLSWPAKALAVDPELRLAVLSDAHLKSGDDHAPGAQALARAVAEINALAQPPDLVLFAGDLAHHSRPDALDLGREILSDLPVPLWAVRGEGDCGSGGIAPWIRHFGSFRFSRAFEGVHFLGLDTAWRRTAHGPAFELGPEQRGWLAQELGRLDSTRPLVMVSHAPLARLFLPWQQWTEDAPEIAPLLARFLQVLFLHGHAHGAGVDKCEGRGQVPRVSKDNDWRGDFLTQNRTPQVNNRLHLSLPATAWPRPQAVQGTPAVIRPGQGPRGCGWVLVTLSSSGTNFHPYLWQS